MLTEALLGLIIIVLLYISFRKPPKLPPGIWGLPVLGYLPSGDTPLADQVTKLRPRYGDVITWRIGCLLNVFLCNYETIKKALNRPELSDRPHYYTYAIFGKGSMKGIIFSNGDLWHKTRRFSLRQLRDLGMGKTKLEGKIQEEARFLVQDFQKHQGVNEKLPLSLGVAVLNIVWKLVADTRFDIDGTEGQDLIDLVCITVDHLQGPIYLFNLFPSLLTLAPSFIKKKLGFFELHRLVDKLMDYMQKVVKEHRATFDPSHPRDLIDQYLIEMKNEENEGTSLYSEFDLQVLIVDLFVAGVETTTSTLRWTILYLIKYPQVQARLQRDIDLVVPKDGFLFYHERNKLPYLEAVVHEIHRVVSLAPLAVAHSASQDTVIEGYSIPKGTVVVANLQCCHKDPKYWFHPNDFHPEHFLNPDGSFNNKKEGFLPFGVGRRQCAGEAMARVELFVFLTALLQNFTFVAPPGETITIQTDPHSLVLNTPKPFRVLITQRH